MLTKPQIRSVLSECLTVGTESYRVPRDLRGAFTITITPEGSRVPVTVDVAVRSLTRDTRKAGVWVDRLKIQKTGLGGVQSLDALLGLTLIGSRAVFVAFDTAHHIPAVGRTTNVQCNEAAVLEAALREGFVEGTKPATGEKLLAFPGHLLTAYLLDVGGRSGEAPAFDQRDAAWYESRRRVRDPGFRDRVLGAYSRRCGLCRLGMDFPEAAHVVPHCLDADDSTENGVALCPNHHAAYDRLGLISFRADRAAMVNRERLDYYASLDEGSVAAFLDSLQEALAPVGLDQAERLARRFELDSERWASWVWCPPDDL